MAAKTFSTYLSELTEATSLGSGDRVPILESSTTKYVDGGDIGGAAYLKYVALLTQSGTDAPVATVLENTLGGTVVWTRNDAGDYSCTLTGAFTEDKTAITNNLTAGFATYFFWNDADTIRVNTTDNLGNFIDGALVSNTVEIRVYP